MRIREQSGSSYGTHQYFYANNATNHTVTASEFYTELATYQQFYEKTMTQGPMAIKLPDGDRRQADMALSALQSAFSNFVGHQPNYGAA